MLVWLFDGIGMFSFVAFALKALRDASDTAASAKVYSATA